MSSYVLVSGDFAAWENRDASAPMWFRLKNYYTKLSARRAEFHALRRTKVVLANSARTRQQIIERIGLVPERIHVVCLGIDSATYRPFGDAERAAARHELGWRTDRPVAAFIGALGYDRNKGFDVLFSSWKMLCQDPAWDVDLVAVRLGRTPSARRGLQRPVAATHVGGYGRRYCEDSRTEFMKHLRIVLVLSEPPLPFGHAVGRWFYVLLRGLVNRGHQVRAFVI